MKELFTDGEDNYSDVFDLVKELGQTVLLDEFNHEPIRKQYKVIKHLAFTRQPKAAIAGEVARLLDLFRKFGGPG